MRPRQQLSRQEVRAVEPKSLQGVYPGVFDTPGQLRRLADHLRDAEFLLTELVVFSSSKSPTIVPGSSGYLSYTVAWTLSSGNSRCALTSQEEVQATFGHLRRALARKVDRRLGADPTYRTSGPYVFYNVAL